MRKNEHPGCSCNQCKRGKRSKYGHFTIKRVNKRVRKLYRNITRLGEEGQVLVSTPFTD